MGRARSSRERMISALKFEEPDAVPLAPYISFQYIPRVCGYRISDWYLGDNKFRAELAVAAYKKLGYDWVKVWFGSPRDWRKNHRVTDVGEHYEVVSIKTGERYSLPKDDVPWAEVGRSKAPKYRLENLVQYPIRSAEEILSRAQEHGTDELPKLIIKEVGDAALLYSGIGTSFYQCVSDMGLEQFIKSIYRDRSMLKKLLERNFTQLVEQGKVLARLGVDAAWVEETMCSTDVISPKFYREYSYPYESRLFEELKELGLYVILYFCGDVDGIVEDILNTGADAYAFEESKKNFTINIYEIREKIRGRACLFGNFDSMNMLRGGSMEEIESAATEMVKKLAPGGGFVMGTGSPVMRDTPIKNVETLMKTTKTKGQYPIK